VAVGSTVISLREAIVVSVPFKARLGVSLRFSGSLRSPTRFDGCGCAWFVVVLVIESKIGKQKVVAVIESKIGKAVATCRRIKRD
jgi:hypothetical protein